MESGATNLGIAVGTYFEIVFMLKTSIEMPLEVLLLIKKPMAVRCRFFEAPTKWSFTHQWIQALCNSDKYSHVAFH